MAITQAQLKRRKNYFGSSDVAAILGVDPFRSPADIFYEKTGRVEEKPATAVMNRGTFLEPGIILFAEDFLGGKILKRDLEITSDDGLFIDHPDGIFKPNKRPVEAKAVHSLSSKEYSTELHAFIDMPLNILWGEELSGIIPKRVAAQCLVHLHCWKQDVCYVPVDLPFRGLQMFIVERNDEVIQRIIEICLEFRDAYIKTDTPPPDSLPSKEIVRFMRRKPKSTIVIPNGLELVRAYENADTTHAAAKAVKDAAKLALLGALKDAEQGNFDGGYVTFFQYHKQAEKKIRGAQDYRSIRVVMEK